MAALILYSRKGCCLCEGLEERLRDLVPSHDLRVVDVDGDRDLQARYGPMVPVLGLATETGVIPLPPVPPRLQGARLRAWLDHHSTP